MLLVYFDKLSWKINCYQEFKKNWSVIEAVILNYLKTNIHFLKINFSLNPKQWFLIKKSVFIWTLFLSYCTAIYILYCIFSELPFIILYFTVMYFTEHYSSILYCIVSYYIIIYCNIVYNIYGVPAKLPNRWRFLRKSQRRLNLNLDLSPAGSSNRDIYIYTKFRLYTIDHTRFQSSLWPKV